MSSSIRGSVVFLFVGWIALASCKHPAKPISVAQTEEAFADAMDAVGVVTTIESGLFKTYEGADQKQWEKRYGDARSRLVSGLDALSPEKLSPADAHAVSVMRHNLDGNLPINPYASSSNWQSSAGTCKDASLKDLNSNAIRDALNSCFDEFGNKLSFEGHRIPRDSALAMLSKLDDPRRRKALFLSFAPLWEALNGKDEVDSPYRRRIKMAAADYAVHGFPIDAAAKAVGQKPEEVERWLEEILDTWRQELPNQQVEPWDYRYSGGEADRVLAPAITRDSMMQSNLRYYHDLGADLKDLGVLFDLEPRPGKAPVTYANFVTMGRDVGGTWHPTVARVSASFDEVGLYVLELIIHEDGHAVNFTALHNRPAFMDLGADEFFPETFADVTGWNVYDPSWQRKYLGLEASESASLRSQYTMVTLETAWALFEIRMLHKPDSDPNVVWTEITNHYLHIVPHPELSWWAQRVQLVDTPGFMVNYGLGCVVTADLRKRISEMIGPFNKGNPQWYPWLSEHVLRSGAEYESDERLKEFLGRPVSPAALLEDLRRISSAKRNVQALAARPGNPQ
jgi:hypothetical protein